MNYPNYKYTIGDIIKTRKTFHLETYAHKPMVVVERWPTYDTNEYKVIVCGYENEFYYFIENDIEGKYE
jgi:hypothetical protein